ncbi:FAD-dependent oxidoreductase [Sulfurospirillum arcachonense]|uniref:FAD-dependent oxidoreductase n=1 Tax=Sulfurospirillum arcachonense TaxID=57666 RepID=UPI0004680671|nr:FAD-dependent oxidoreductase [Sulfurospirillum arcachonense]
MFDILIVGSGGAGLSAALEAKKQGAKVAVICQSAPTNAATCMAQGGFNGVIYDDEGDSPSLHVKDTMTSSSSLAIEKNVKDMCEGAKEDIFWLEDIGMPFSRKKDRIAQRKFGAASKDRTAYSQDYTGLKLLHTLYDNCLKEGIAFLDNSFVLELIVEEGTCKGVVLLDIQSGEIKAFESKSVVLATGGYAGIYHGFSTNGIESTGDGLALALKSSAILSDMEFVQFHPTSLKSSSVLVSESARGAGGFLLNQKGERFVEELMTRDEVSRAVFSQMKKNNSVFLDIRHLGSEFINKNLPQEKKLINIHEHIDPSEQLIPISPAAHYSMGGVDVDEDLQTNVQGLFAVGECSNVKVHGANRLGGNSLLEIVHFGRKVAKTSYMYAQKTSLHVELKSYEKKVKKEIDKLLQNEKSDTFFALREELGKELFEKAGIYRDEEGLKSLIHNIENIEARYNKLTISDTNMSYNTWLVSHLKFGNSLSVAKALSLCAIQREESRGAHYRDDFQKPANEALHSYVQMQNSALHVRFLK